MNGRGEKYGLAVRLFAAFALVFLSFAHKPALAQYANSAISAEYLLPDGTFADICFGTDGVGHDAGHGKRPARAPVCEACRLAASILLPAPPEEGQRVENGSWHAAPTVTAVQIDFAARRLLPPPRGPPILS